MNAPTSSFVQGHKLTSALSFFAGVLFYLSKWYTKSELNLRMSIFYSGSLISGAFGNLIAAGILSGLAGKQGLAAWQWLYIIEGVSKFSLSTYSRSNLYNFSLPMTSRIFQNQPLQSTFPFGAALLIL